MTTTTSTGGTAPGPPISIADAAAECGVTVATFISWLVASGMLLVIPGTEDPRCEWMVVDGVAYHVEDCGCQFIASPHPDLAERPR